MRAPRRASPPSPKSASRRGHEALAAASATGLRSHNPPRRPGAPRAPPSRGRLLFLTMNALDTLVQDLGHPGTPVELAVLLGCLAVAFLACWAVGRKHRPESVWFGRAIVDGLMFP